MRLNDAMWVVVFVSACGGRTSGESGDSGSRASDADAHDAGPAVDADVDSEASPLGGPCDTYKECPTPAVCLPPGGFYGCGYCPPPMSACSTDSTCTPGYVCESFQCNVDSCQSGQDCVRGCTSDADCSIGQGCGVDHHCVATPCTSDAECPPNFACDGIACQRKTCSSDTDCTGACVSYSPARSSTCWSGPGTCMPPPE